MLRLIRIVAAVVLLGGCATHRVREPLGELPVLRLSPASLGRELALQQRLQVSAAGQTQTLDALLEVDAQELRLGVQALGQSALTLRWDGKALREQRADWVPAMLRGDRILFDLQMVFWPTGPIQAALPEGWALQETAGQRRLLHAGQEVLSVSYLADDHAVLKQLRDGYQLDIGSTAVAGAPP